MVQEVVWGVSIVLMGTLAAVFAWVAIGANVALADYGPIIASAYRLRTWLFGLAIIVLIGANYDTLGKLPYVSSMSASSSATTTQPVEAVAEQWSWSIKPDAFRVGDTVDFHVASKDFNHGLALYNQDMRNVAHTQAKPVYIKVKRYTFEEPGIYRVLCLEYCGVGHHEMTAEIKVSAH
jgi:cytochrome c oxidase subunit 2